MKEEGMFPVEMLDRALQEPLFSSGTEKRRQALAPHVTASFLRAFRTGKFIPRWIPPCSAEFRKS